VNKKHHYLEYSDAECDSRDTYKDDWSLRHPKH